MKKYHTIPLLLVLFLTSVNCYSQDTKADEKLRYENRIATERTTLHLEFEIASLEKVKALKNELLTYDGKIITVDIDVNNTLISITKTGKLQEKDLFEIIEKYEITYQRIISKNEFE